MIHLDEIIRLIFVSESHERNFLALERENLKYLSTFPTKRTVAPGYCNKKYLDPVAIVISVLFFLVLENVQMFIRAARRESLTDGSDSVQLRRWKMAIAQMLKNRELHITSQRGGLPNLFPSITDVQVTDRDHDSVVDKVIKVYCNYFIFHHSNYVCKISFFDENKFL